MNRTKILRAFVHVRVCMFLDFDTVKIRIPRPIHVSTLSLTRNAKAATKLQSTDVKNNRQPIRRTQHIRPRTLALFRNKILGFVQTVARKQLI